MAVQQHRVSKMRCRRRKAANRYKGIQTDRCSKCGDTRLPHRVCPSCGFYKDRQIISTSTE